MPNIHHALLIESSAENIYHAITSQEGLSAWWTPGAKTTGKLHSVLHFPFGSIYFKEMELTELKPLEWVKWNCIQGDNEWIGTNISFKLLAGHKVKLLNAYPEMRGQVEQQKTGIGTVLLFHHDDWKAYTVMFAECSYTWARFLRSLKMYCETGKGKPWPNQHL